MATPTSRLLCLLLMAGLLWIPSGCRTQEPQPAAEGVPLVRVRLHDKQSRIVVAATHPPVVTASSDSTPRALNFPRGTEVPVTLQPGGWRVGNLSLGTGTLTIKPAVEGSVSVNGAAHRGQYRLVPVGPGTFDVINDVDLEGYLKGVVSKELLWNWHDEAYRAQAIVARTYALYELKTAGRSREWDLYPDERSQVYGGLGAETRKSRHGVDSTAGVVVAYGPPSQERIFKAYFSSCCGGITQSGADAFAEPYLPPLSDQNVHFLCNASPRFNWGPIVIKKDELTRRIRGWGARKGRPEASMALLARIDIQATNRWGRPVRFVITDTRGTRYSLNGEEIRWAVNYSAGRGPTLYSSFFKPISDGDVIRFTDGHGWGHGVGMCQWCAQRRAEAGMRHEDIVLAAFQRAKLVRAY